MNIKILFFGKIREQINIDHKLLYINNNITLDLSLNNLINIIHSEYPVLKDTKIMYSINNEYIYDKNIIVNDNDVVGFIPPISGG